MKTTTIHSQQQRKHIHFFQYNMTVNYYMIYIGMVELARKNTGSCAAFCAWILCKTAGMQKKCQLEAQE
jgi:hypothetical protein